DRQVIVENWHAELWIDDPSSVDTYLRTWSTLRESAVYGVDAQNVIHRARRALNTR
ncbi:transcriptional regulator, partial [Streptomyces sp. NPDC005728]